MCLRGSCAEDGVDEILQAAFAEFLVVGYTIQNGGGKKDRKNRKRKMKRKTQEKGRSDLTLSSFSFSSQNIIDPKAWKLARIDSYAKHAIWWLGRAVWASQICEPRSTEVGCKKFARCRES